MKQIFYKRPTNHYLASAAWCLWMISCLRTFFTVCLFLFLTHWAFLYIECVTSFRGRPRMYPAPHMTPPHMCLGMCLCILVRIKRWKLTQMVGPNGADKSTVYWLYAWVCINMGMYACIFYACICVYGYVYPYMYVCMYVCTHDVCMYRVYMRVCVHKIVISICAHTHTLMSCCGSAPLPATALRRL